MVKANYKLLRMTCILMFGLVWFITLSVHTAHGTGAVRSDEKKRPRVAITQGHGEADSVQLWYLVDTLRDFCDVSFVQLTNNVNTFRDTTITGEVQNRYDILIMVAPDTGFTRAELFILDQFIMRGGRALFCVDGTSASIDSLRENGTLNAMAMNYGVNDQPGLTNMLFNYGARLNSDLVQDMLCGQIVLVSGTGAQMQFVPKPWIYSPALAWDGKNPYTYGVSNVKCDFVSTIDTVTTKTPIHKEYLLRTSKNSRKVTCPHVVSLSTAMADIDAATFTERYFGVAVKLEGSFTSFFENLLVPGVENESPGFISKGKPSKIIVIADGDVSINPVVRGRPAPLGLNVFNRLSNEFYANQSFLANCINYLAE